MKSDLQDPLKRFSSRVKDYVKSRPSYPAEIIEFFVDELELHTYDKVADIGSGTGKFSELLLQNRYTVYCVEPNREMREAAEKLLGGYSNFISVDGTAENTKLADHSVKYATCAQAFHWFDPYKVKIELKRILSPDGWVVLIWNSRRVDSTDFMKEYEKFLLEFSVDYAKVNHKNIDEGVLKSFFIEYKLKKFPYSQSFDFDGLKSRLLSSSYVPKGEHPKFHEMIIELENMFNKNQNSGKVEFIYDTEVYYGKI